MNYAKARKRVEKYDMDKAMQTVSTIILEGAPSTTAKFSIDIHTFYVDTYDISVAYMCSGGLLVVKLDRRAFALGWIIYVQRLQMFSQTRIYSAT